MKTAIIPQFHGKLKPFRNSHCKAQIKPRLSMAVSSESSPQGQVRLQVMYKSSVGDLHFLAALNIEQLATLEGRHDRLIARLARHERLGM